MSGLAGSRNTWQGVLVVVFWAYVGIPLAWGIYETLKKAMTLFID